MERKTVLITGGARGQGREHAVRFAQNGYDVILGDVIPPESQDFQQTADELGRLGSAVLAKKCDVSSIEDVDQLFLSAWERFGRIDVVIANAGIMNFGKIWELTEQQVKTMLDINLIGAWRTNRAASVYMMKQGFGRIINISSTAGLKASMNLGHYCMAKFGVVGLTKTLAKEIAKYGVTVNAVCQTMVRSPMTERPEFIAYINENSGTNYRDFSEMDAAMKKKRAMGVAFVACEQVSALCYWLGNSPEAAMITGACIPFDAGSLL